jgi:hypothetical protein
MRRTKLHDLIINMRRTVITETNSWEIVEIERFSDCFDAPQKTDCQVLLKDIPGDVRCVVRSDKEVLSSTPPLLPDSLINRLAVDDQK